MSPAVWAAIHNIYMNALLYYLDISKKNKENRQARNMKVIHT